MFRILCLLIGYGIGCIQSAYIVGKFMHVDIRNYGSGNLGSTNALRVLGKKAGAFTFFCDLMKSIIAFWLCRMLFHSAGASAGYYACAGVILGHDFPFYLKFKGGKGIASMIGMILCTGGTPLIISYAAGIIGLMSRYVSVGSIFFSLSLPFAFYAAKEPMELVGLMAVLGVLAVFRHRSNISRLIQGNENRLGAKKTISATLHKEESK
ncbi:MAG: glycerol-3-phosphate 1-O-acyltransferase PlsY [Clostridiales bacterium]|nr:glycerol-3-phosphate 1-O-acyltransferase PlsY [Clostridiales bacterium]